MAPISPKRASCIMSSSTGGWASCRPSRPAHAAPGAAVRRGCGHLGGPAVWEAVAQQHARYALEGDGGLSGGAIYCAMYMTRKSSVGQCETPFWTVQSPLGFRGAVNSRYAPMRSYPACCACLSNHLWRGRASVGIRLSTPASLTLVTFHTQHSANSFSSECFRSDFV